jgi:hypothetical protein
MYITLHKITTARPRTPLLVDIAFSTKPLLATADIHEDLSALLTPRCCNFLDWTPVLLDLGVECVLGWHCDCVSFERMHISDLHLPSVVTLHACILYE